MLFPGRPVLPLVDRTAWEATLGTRAGAPMGERVPMNDMFTLLDFSLRVGKAENDFHIEKVFLICRMLSFFL